jgi:hypothetical protein
VAGQLGEMIVVLDERFAEESLGVEQARSGTFDERVQARPELGVVALLQAVDEATEEVGGEIDVDLHWLFVEHRHAVTDSL